jgi:hypothetical protein
MKEIIEAKIKQTKIDYNDYGLYSNEEYNGRINALEEVLNVFSLSQRKIKPKK